MILTACLLRVTQYGCLVQALSSGCVVGPTFFQFDATRRPVPTSCSTSGDLFAVGGRGGSWWLKWTSLRAVTHQHTNLAVFFSIDWRVLCDLHCVIVKVCLV